MTCPLFSFDLLRRLHGGTQQPFETIVSIQYKLSSKRNARQKTLIDNDLEIKSQISLEVNSQGSHR
jgi:hypothetical protein